MRGTAKFFNKKVTFEGITPAHAGNSYQYDCKTTYKRDHPRTCGEQQYFANIGSKPMGSPPHMRGTGSAQKSTLSCFRITPAHAGNRLAAF